MLWKLIARHYPASVSTAKERCWQLRVRLALSFEYFRCPGARSSISSDVGHIRLPFIACRLISARHYYVFPLRQTPYTYFVSALLQATLLQLAPQSSLWVPQDKIGGLEDEVTMVRTRQVIVQQNLQRVKPRSLQVMALRQIPVLSRLIASKAALSVVCCDAHPKLWAEVLLALLAPIFHNQLLRCGNR